MASQQSARGRRSATTRNIPCATQCLLWGRAAGRCEFRGCNRPVWRSGVTQETRNLGEKAHIYPFGAAGPRADADAAPADVHDPANLMLLCGECHHVIDTGDGPTRYPADLLRQMKSEHETRVEIVAGIAPRLRTHILTYGTFIGDHVPLPTFAAAATAVFPHRIPATPGVIELGSRTGPRRDRHNEFWAREREQLGYQYDRQVRVPLERGEVEHLSVFALAPQPLLIEFGSLIGEITPAEVFQLHREPQGWDWPADGTHTEIQVRPADEVRAHAALVLAVSATVAPERVRAVLGQDVSIWTVTVPEPGTDVVKSRETLSAFRASARALLAEIAAHHGGRTPLHVFPALPVSLAVELGRLRMPKSDSPWVLYDEQQALGGFVPTFTLGDPEAPGA